MADPRITSRDVARRAGVSQSTVSYVLNSTPGQSISVATRTRVQDAALALGYTPSAAARALRAGSTNTVLVLLADVPVSVPAVAILETLSATLRPFDYTVAIQRRDDRQLLRVLQALTPTAVVTIGAFSPAETDAVAAHGIPVVGVSLDGGDGHVMHIPQRTIGRLQAEHLAARGHSHLAYAASTDPLATALVRGRLGGVHEVCAERGLPQPVVIDVPLYPDAATRAVRRLRAHAEPVTGVCAYDDEVALAVLAGMRGAGLTAPHDIAVAGADDLPLALLTAPAITTVAVRTSDVGAGLARHVLNRLQPGLGLGEPDDQPSIVLVARATT